MSLNLHRPAASFLERTQAENMVTAVAFFLLYKDFLRVCLVMHMADVQLPLSRLDER